MFGSIRTLLSEARGRALWQEYRDLTKRLAALPEPHAERCGHACVSLADQWAEKFGPVDKCEVSTRKMAVQEFKDTAKQRYDSDKGVSLAYALFSVNLEASYLRGEDAKIVYDQSSVAIRTYLAMVNRETVKTAKTPDGGPMPRRFGVWCVFDDGGQHRESWYNESDGEITIYAKQEEAEATAEALRFTVGLSDVAASFSYSVREIP
jgi:hypothetical protein